MKQRLATVIALGAASLLPAQAAVVFGEVGNQLTFDAIVLANTLNANSTTPGNTVRTDEFGSAPGFTYSAYSNTTSIIADNLWTSLANRLTGGGYAVESAATTIGIPASYGGLELLGTSPGDDAAPGLTTTISGLASGQYDVYVFYISRASNSSDVNLGSMRAALHGGDTSTIYTGANDTVQMNGALYALSAVQIGTTAAGVTDFSVDVANAFTRQNYVGVGYITVPEPGSLALLGLGGLALGIRRRRA
jgi:hypothetical protein